MKGGKVLDSGSYGCIFRPPLLCEGQTERQKGYVTKLMLNKEARNEYEEIQKFLQYIKSIPNYQKYFIIDGISRCKPTNITVADLEDFNKKCKALTNQQITAALVKDEKFIRGKVSALQIPDGGSSVLDYLERPGITGIDVINVNNALIELIQYGIRPMNIKGVIHADVKAGNIVYNSATKEAKLIDWGLSEIANPQVESRGNPKTFVPILNFPLMFNQPVTNLFFYKNFPLQAKYKQFLYSFKKEITRTLQNNSREDIQIILIDNIQEYLYNKIFNSGRNIEKFFKDNILGHYSYIAEVYFNKNTEEFRRNIAKQIAGALFAYSYDSSQNRLNEFNTGLYFQQVFKMNADIYGALSCLTHLVHARRGKIRHGELKKAVKEFEDKYMFSKKSVMQPYNVPELVASLRNLNQFMVAPWQFKSLSAAPAPAAAPASAAAPAPASAAAPAPAAAPASAAAPAPAAPAPARIASSNYLKPPRFSPLKTPPPSNAARAASTLRKGLKRMINLGGKTRRKPHNKKRRRKSKTRKRR